ncbi:MAG: helix-turn-helix domain-containing protein, partial [Actinomycetota bacterium]|nr:helix-turn-helix domain-containing protein [Actinomycetota bacterium]
LCMNQNRPVLTDPEALEALAHPVRLDVLNYLMSNGPATASVCARAVGDTPSNCSYHLRILARHDLVEPGPEEADGRKRPWRARVTGFTIPKSGSEPGTRQARGEAALMAAALQLDQRGVREYLTHRDRAPDHWREVDAYATYTLRVTPQELGALVGRLDELIRPLIAAIRQDDAAGAELVNLGLYAFPRLEGPWARS